MKHESRTGQNVKVGVCEVAKPGLCSVNERVQSLHALLGSVHGTVDELVNSLSVVLRTPLPEYPEPCEVAVSSKDSPLSNELDKVLDHLTSIHICMLRLLGSIDL